MNGFTLTDLYGAPGAEQPPAQPAAPDLASVNPTPGTSSVALWWLLLVVILVALRGLYELGS